MHQRRMLVYHFLKAKSTLILQFFLFFKQLVNFMQFYDVPIVFVCLSTIFYYKNFNISTDIKVTAYSYWHQFHSRLAKLCSHNRPHLS